MMHRRSLFKIIAACGFVLGPITLVTRAQAVEMDRTIAFYAYQSTDRGLRFLRTQQGSDGSWQGDVGLTALALRAFVTSYREYTTLDGPFIWKPASWLTDTLAAMDGPALDGVPTGDLADAVSTLRRLDAKGQAALIERLQDALAARRPTSADGASLAQYEIHVALVALAGNRGEPAATFRREAASTLAALQLPNRGFPGAAGEEALPMTAASAVSLGLTLQSAHSEDARAALARTVELFATAAEQEDAVLPVFFYFTALQRAMTRAERRGGDGGLGPAQTWRDTLAFSILEGQAEDGGWVPGTDDRTRIAASARAVNAVNGILPPV